ncbi:23613_t:CDS:1 [Cetraspora pellucida]|uniref:23613_t:CDS:1 n=1 Tax=Cetraspora pellucida TaxID=1433469 RepID=A0A9N9H4F2_9GLOM|nr:23613_t:CDS:1 [Cetraspora pellucida]
MPSVSHSLSTSRCNVTVACDSCKCLKKKCGNIGNLDQPDKCSECLKRNVECTYSVPHKKRGPPKRGPKKCGHKKRCPKPIPTTPLPPHKIIEFNVNGLWEMLYDLSQIDNNSEFSTQDLITNDQMEILTSTSSLPCPYENTAGHCCHMGCIVRYKYNI